MPDQDQLHDKFTARRTDPAAQARHAACPLFVLDVRCDKYAQIAALSYADACDGTQPGLASDLRQLVMRARRDGQVRK